MSNGAGIAKLFWNGVELRVVGDVSYNLGYPKREEQMSSKGYDGPKIVQQVPMFELTIRTSSDLDQVGLINAKNDTFLIEEASGRQLLFAAADFSGEGGGNTEEGTMAVRVVGKKKGQIIKAANP